MYVHDGNITHSWFYRHINLMKISFHCFGISITVISCMPHEKSSMIFGSRAPDPWWWHHFLGWRLGQLLSWSARSSAGRKLSDPNLRSVWHDTMLGVLCLKKSGGFVSLPKYLLEAPKQATIYMIYLIYLYQILFQVFEGIVLPKFRKGFWRFSATKCLGFPS